MVPPIKNVLVAGPNGTLGPPIIRALINANFTVTLLTRSAAKTKTIHSELNVIEADYDAYDKLTATLSSQAGKQDAIIILLNRDAFQAQVNLTEAAAAAGITHVIPSSFGIGTRDPDVRRLPIWETKVDIEDYVLKRAEQGLITFTGIQTGVFFDWAIGVGAVVDVKGLNSPTVIFDGGDVPFSVTVLDDIGKAVATALTKADELKNRWLFVHNAVITQNQMYAYAKEFDPQRERKFVPMDTAIMAEQAWEKYNRGERGRDVMRGFFPRATFGFKKGLFEQTDNEILGIERWSEEDLRGFVRSCIEEK